MKLLISYHIDRYKLIIFIRHFSFSFSFCSKILFATIVTHLEMTYTTIIDEPPLSNEPRNFYYSQFHVLWQKLFSLASHFKFSTCTNFTTFSSFFFLRQLRFRFYFFFIPNSQCSPLQTRELLFLSI